MEEDNLILHSLFIKPKTHSYYRRTAFLHSRMSKAAMMRIILEFGEEFLKRNNTSDRQWTQENLREALHKLLEKEGNNDLSN